MKENQVSTHYSNATIINSIRSGLQKSGIDLENVSVDDLGPVDEFHTGGRVATEHLLNELNFDTHKHVLDIGCGIGGTSRYLADRYNTTITGIDLTNEYIDAGNILNQWVSLDDKISLQCADANNIPSEDNEFDLAVMLHVGMNIADKFALFTEVARVLNKGGEFAIYDVMLKDAAEINYPVPWATDKSMSYLEPMEHYVDYLERAGFRIEKKLRRGEFAKSFFRKMQNATENSNEPPAIGLHLLVGPSVKEKMGNFSKAVFDGLVEPTEIIARKR